MTHGEFKSWAIGQGWNEDRFGHLVASKLSPKTGEFHEYRFKLQAISVRLEKKCKIGGKNEWIRIRSNYYSKLTINATTNKLEGMNI